MTTLTDSANNNRNKTNRRRINLPWIWDVLIVLILLIGAVFRFTGLNWDGDYHLHPDERFLTMVESAINPVESLKEYFDTSTSSLNPNNHGYTFYVYGTLPLFIVRYVGELFGKTGYGQIFLVGRAVSGVFDLGSVVLIFLIGRKLYKNAKLGLLAALFSAMSVLQIQLSHYFTVDTMANFFAYAAIYAGVCIMMSDFRPAKSENEPQITKVPAWKPMLTESHLIGTYAIFGILAGMALASKVSLYPVVFLLPISAIIYYYKQPKETRGSEVNFILRNLVVAGALAVIAFRVFQPYAFLGPGFFGIKINPGWIASLKELATISKGEVDVPYALQWARRSLAFAPQNLVLWGLGLSLGVLSLFGFIWMAWRMIKGDWQKHLLMWGWTGYILVTLSISHVRSMRYLLPIYPALALIAAWTIFKLWESSAGAIRKINSIHFNWRRFLAVAAAIVTIVGTAAWAAAFTSIYTRPVTRVAASQWIYENISSAIEMPIATEEGTQLKQLFSYQNSVMVSSAQPFTYGFTADSTGTMTSITFEHVLFNTQYNPNLTTTPEVISFVVNLRDPSLTENSVVSTSMVQSTFLPMSDARGDALTMLFNPPILLTEGKKYELEITVIEPDINLKLDDSLWLTYSDGAAETHQYMPPPAYRLTSSSPFQFVFMPQAAGTVSQIRLNRVVDLLNLGTNQELTVTITDPNLPDQVLATGRLSSSFTAMNDPRGEEAWITFDRPLVLSNGIMYSLKLSLSSGEGALAIYNDITAVESTWDDALPLPMYGYNVFDYTTGLFGNNQNLEAYFDDTQSKKDSLYNNLDQSDVIFISSNRQWGTITRVPERYPLTSAYYRAMIGCPEDKDILWCYQVAKPGMFNEKLGFKLVAVFQSNPTIFGIEINDQSSEEAFTVYDHPKVLIFEKTADYDPAKMRAVLDQVDITSAVHLSPRQASRFNGNLLLGKEEAQIQQSGGTWSELFPADSPLNTKPWLAVVVWYLAITLLGWIAYPIVRVIFHGLPDHGYPFSRLAGLVLTAYLTWLAGSTFFTFSRLTIGVVLLILTVISGFLAFRQRQALLEEIKTKKTYFLAVEVFTLFLFLISLGIRYGNPDLWHAWKGGEKPMDLSYFTAVLKSTVFPPYDPWYAGGYINYYYFGFVLVGVPVKFLGILPGLAYNLILPTLFAFTGMGAYSIGWNLFARIPTLEEEEAGKKANLLRRNVAGLISVFTVLIMGNLGTVRMIWQGIQRLAAPGGVIDNAKFTDRFIWFFQGIGKFFTGVKLPYGYGDWYWIPSRALPGEAITEFPFFTFTYADLHAHLIDLSITILVIGWGLGILMSKWELKSDAGFKRWVNFAITILFGGIAIGMLKVTNTWDYPTYLLLSSLLILYSILRYAQVPEKFLADRPFWLRKANYAIGVIVLLVGLTVLLYLPFSENYAQAYGSISLWTSSHSPLSSYLVHWGVQLFLLITWFVWETHEWLASTPASSLKKLQPYAGYLQGLAVLFGVLLILLTVLGVQIGWLVGILGAWAVILIFRPGQSDAKRMVLFMTGTALVLTLFVELFVLVGDIGRMNTVFKFYYQAWTFFGLSSAAALVWLIPAVTTRWKTSTSTIWQVCLALTIFGAALYPITASIDKIRDRMSTETPATLNGLEFMSTSRYYDANVDMDLSQDYRAILWMQQNVQGSPVIVETNTVEYRWGNRYTIYTGLPGVLGWNWHQRQQRGSIDNNGIVNRLNDITVFYTTEDVQIALDFLDKYNVSYIILGQMERAYFPGAGLDKFEQYDGTYWEEVYREQDTVIYEVFGGD